MEAEIDAEVLAEAKAFGDAEGVTVTVGEAVRAGDAVRAVAVPGDAVAGGDVLTAVITPSVPAVTTSTTAASWCTFMREGAAAAVVRGFGVTMEMMFLSERGREAPTIC
jgi:hypothetical protein